MVPQVKYRNMLITGQDANASQPLKLHVIWHMEAHLESTFWWALPRTSNYIEITLIWIYKITCDLNCFNDSVTVIYLRRTELPLFQQLWVGLSGPSYGFGSSLDCLFQELLWKAYVVYRTTTCTRGRETAFRHRVHQHHQDQGHSEGLQEVQHVLLCLTEDTVSEHWDQPAFAR